MHTATPTTSPTLKHHMKEGGHTTYSLSKATGIPYTTLTRHLENPRGIRLDDLFSIAEALSLDPSTILEAVTP